MYTSSILPFLALAATTLADSTSYSSTTSSVPHPTPITPTGPKTIAVDLTDNKSCVGSHLDLTLTAGVCFALPYGVQSFTYPDALSNGPWGNTTFYAYNDCSGPTGVTFRPDIPGCAGPTGNIGFVAYSVKWLQ